MIPKNYLRIKVVLNRLLLEAYIKINQLLLRIFSSNVLRNVRFYLLVFFYSEFNGDKCKNDTNPSFNCIPLLEPAF